MTGPEGDRHDGWWRVLAVDAPTASSSRTASPTTTAAPNLDMPVTTTAVELGEKPAAARA